MHTDTVSVVAYRVACMIRGTEPDPNWIASLLEAETPLHASPPPITQTPEDHD